MSLPPTLKRGKSPLRALFHHMMKTIHLLPRQALDKGILLSQILQYPIGIVVFQNKARHFDCKFIRQPHHRQKLPLLLSQRIDHCCGKKRINIRIFICQTSVLRQITHIQINRRKPSLAGIKQALDLLLIQRKPAAFAING